MADITQTEQLIQWKATTRLVDPDNAVVRSLKQASDFINKDVLPPVDLAVTLLDLAATAAPFYANTTNAVLRLAIKEFREFLYSLRLSGHFIVADVPYGFSHGGALPEPGAFDRLKARAMSLSPKDAWAGLEKLSPGTLTGGAPGLLKVLTDSITDPGDANKPALTSDSTFCGISLVVSAADPARLMVAVRALKRLVTELMGSDVEPDPTGIRLDVRVKHVGGRPTLRVKDSTDYPLGKVKLGGWEVKNKPYGFRVWVSSTPGDAGRTPYQSAADMVTKVESEDNKLQAGDDQVVGNGAWKLYGAYQEDPSTRRTIYTFELDGAKLRQLAPVADAQALEQWNICVEALHYIHFENGTIARTRTFSGPVLYTPIVTGSPAALSVAPNWRALSPSDVPAAGVKNALTYAAGKRDALSAMVTDFDENVLEPFEDELKDKSDQLVKAVLKVKKKTQKIRDIVAVTDGVIQAITSLAQLEATIQARAFNYFELLDQNQKKGVGGLIAEYAESFAELPQQGGQDLVAGVFFVMAGPASLGSQFMPVWRLLCSLFSVDSTVKATWEALGSRLGGPASAKPAGFGQVDSGITSSGKALVGEQDDGVQDLNCPPARDLSQMQFGPDFKPLA